MILKGNIRAHGQELAAHLLNDKHELDLHRESFRGFRVGNEAVELAELRGFAADDLQGAFAEAEAIASATNCTKYLYSLSINPNEPLSRQQYAAAIEKAETALGLDGQPRAVVFHVKNGREHCHVAWSRIDGETMTARHMAFDRQKLRELSRELARDFGHELPEGLAQDRGTERFAHRFNDVSMAEKGMAERTGLSTEERRAVITKAYRQCDNAESFTHALHDQGFILAQGDKRAFVVVDRAGEVHALSRQIEGARAKDIRDTLKLDQTELPSVQEARDRLAREARLEASQEARQVDDPAKQLAEAEAHLKATRDAHRAELRMLSSGHKDHLKAIKEQETKELAYAHKAVKEAYRSDWRDTFKRQREELKLVSQLKESPLQRLRYILDHKNMDKTQEGARGHLKAAFSWLTKTKEHERESLLRVQIFPESTRAGVKDMFRFVMKGDFDFRSVERAHKQERRDLADLQTAALTAECREIRAQAKHDRMDAREDHTATLAAIRLSHAQEREKAEQSLKSARELNERSGVDRRDGDVRPQAQKPAERPQWGFSKQGFEQQGFKSRDERERDDERERFIKPPGASFTP